MEITGGLLDTTKNGRISKKGVYRAPQKDKIIRSGWGWTGHISPGAKSGHRFHTIEHKVDGGVKM